MKKSIILTAVLALTLSSCKDDFLERYPEGGTMRQDQYEKLDNQLEGSVRGLYSKLYTMGGSSHDEFGKRSIDLWGDLLCGDIALRGKTYGWLFSDEQMLTVNRTGTIWGHYYSQLHNINATILAFKNGSSLVQDIEDYGWPSEIVDDSHKYTAADTTNAIYYAQALGLRGYIYSQLVKWYTPVLGCEYIKGQTIYDYPCAPLYTEYNMTVAGSRATSWEIYKQVFSDLETAIKLYDEFGGEYNRANKLELDRDVLCGILAMAYLNESVYQTPEVEAQTEVTQQSILEKARDYALEVDKNKYTILPVSELLTNGFNNVANKGWIWGQEVTIEVSGGLKSWFGQVDIHSYSYAWAGDAKAIDDGLWAEAKIWDKRKDWFNDGEANSVYKLCPDKKFFSADNPTSTKDDDLDREWLSDNVFMRVEAMYLIAAEAEWRLGHYDEAKEHLLAITNQRVYEDDPMATNSYQTWCDELGDPTTLRDAIRYNWRMEMWGEGYGLETFRRWGIDGKRGGNHIYASGVTIKPTDSKFNMNIPSSESTYNPNIKK